MENSIFVAGGVGGGRWDRYNVNLRSSERFDLTEKKWTKSYKMPLTFPDIRPNINDFHASDALKVTVDTDERMAIITSELMQNKMMVFTIEEGFTAWKSVKEWCIPMVHTNGLLAYHDWHISLVI